MLKELNKMTDLEKAIDYVQSNIDMHFAMEAEDDEEMYSSIIKLLEFAKDKSGYKEKYEPSEVQCIQCNRPVKAFYAYNGHIRYRCTHCGCSCIS